MAAEQMGEELNNECVLFLSSASWQGLWTRKQLMAKRLASRNHVVYLEPQLSGAYMVRVRGRLRLKGQGPHPDDGVSVVSPPHALPAYTRSWIIHGINMQLLRRYLRGVLGAAGLDPTVLWFYDPAMARVRHAWPSATVVYDCVDRHDSYPGRGRLIRELQTELVRISSAVVVTSKALKRDFAAFREDVELVPNGVDLTLFDDAVALPPGSLPTGGPLIGFVGGIGEWVDLELVDGIASERPSWRVCLAGPVANGVPAGRLTRRPNVRLLGRIERRHVPSFLREMDVCILPFRVNRLTAAVNPLKLFEYFAAGKPVVSTPMDEVRSFTPLVIIATDAREFVEAIDRLLSTGDCMQAERRAAAREHSWSALLPRLEATMAAGVASSRGT